MDEQRILVEIHRDAYDILVKMARESVVKRTPEEELEDLIVGMDNVRHTVRGKPGRVPCHRINCYEKQEENTSPL